MYSNIQSPQFGKWGGRGQEESQVVRAGCRLVRVVGTTFGFEIRCLFTVWPRAVSESLCLAGPEFSL